MQVIYEDNHIIIVNKKAGEIVQGDKTRDRTLSDDVKEYIRRKYSKPGEVFLGTVHRLDRPAMGLVIFARTSKALTRLNDMLRLKDRIHKTYWAIVTARPPEDSGHIENYLVRNQERNKTYVTPRKNPEAKLAALDYRLIASGERYHLLEINLLTGRHHQIRCQLAALGCPIRGDLKYGAKRSNPDGSISLLARRLEFEHPVSHKLIEVEAPLPKDKLWNLLATIAAGRSTDNVSGSAETGRKDNLAEPRR